MNEESDDKGGIDTAAVIASASQDVATIPANVTTVVMSEENASTDNVITTTSAENVDTVTQDSVQGNVTTVVMTEGANTVVATSSDTVPDTIAAPTGGPPRVAAGHIVNAVNLMSHMSQADVSDESIFSADEDDSGAEEPATKRLKLEQDINIDMDQSVKQILFNINKAICLRLDSIENKLESVGMRTKYLEEKVVELCAQRNNSVFNPYATKRGSTSQSQRSSAVIVGLPQEKNNGEAVNSGGFNTQMDNNFRNLGSNVTLITLNSEEDYPNGCWLGDENNPEMRVRVPISSSDLLHIHSNCRTPEKMALTLLDYLFDRETQACSNLSGMGKHGKKQLDPLMIYGIWCHLIYRFGVGESDWQRIKQNIDSKCRTAFRRKLRGLPLTVKAFRGKAPPSYVYNPVMGLYNSIMNSQSSFEDYSNHEDNKFHIQQGDVDIQHAVTMQGEAIQQGEIQILHATPEQISQLQQAQHIQILQGDHVIQQLQSGDGPDGVQVAVSMGTPDGVHVATVTTDNGEVLHIHQAQAAAAANQTVTTAPGTSTATTAAAATSVTSAAPSSEQQE